MQWYLRLNPSIMKQGTRWPKQIFWLLHFKLTRTKKVSVWPDREQNLINQHQCWTHSYHCDCSTSCGKPATISRLMEWYIVKESHWTQIYLLDHCDFNLFIKGSPYAHIHRQPTQVVPKISNAHYIYWCVCDTVKSKTCCNQQDS